MSMSDTIADMLTRIRNAGNVQHPRVSMPSSEFKTSIARVLREEGYISDYQVDDFGDNKKELQIGLKYKKNVHVIEGIKRISHPSLRVYVGAPEIPRVLGGLGIVIMTTPNGVMTGKKAKKQNVGGEVLCYVW